MAECNTYRFTIRYYFARYHTGYLDETKSRTAVVTGQNIQEAINKIHKADESYIAVKDVSFEELHNDFCSCGERRTDER